MAELDTDIVVIGAGLSGLCAARKLSRAGHATTVLEARDRVGGRTLSQAIDGGTYDLGGQWVGPTQRRMLGLIAELGLETHLTHTEGRQILELGGKRSTYSGTIPRLSPWTLMRLQLGIHRIERAMSEVPAEAPWTAKGAASLDAMTVESWMRQRVKSPGAIGVIRAAVRVILGAELGELSMLAFLHYCRSSGGLMTLVETTGGHQERRIVGGAQQISERLAEEAGRLILSAPVSAITQEAERVIVHHGKGQTSARYAIVTLPLAMVDRLRFHPPVPTLRDQLTQRVTMGATVKCLMTYEAPFWRKEGLSGEAVSGDGPISVVYDNCDPEGRACLVAFVVGAPARGWSDRPERERKARVLEHMARLFGPQAASPRAYQEQDWSREPESGGAPVVNFPPGTLSRFGPALRAPVGRVHWAGSESARAFVGFMEGALESGLRAADEILERAR